jgi:hypothetical protein
MLQLAMTYETITPESAENGESEDHGFVFEACDCGARELMRYIQRDGFTEPSDSHGVPRWLTMYGDADYRTGEVENRSIHPGADSQSQRVWARVLKIAGVTR